MEGRRAAPSSSSWRVPSPGLLDGSGNNPTACPGGRGRGQGEGGQVATGRAGVVIVTGSWRPTKTQKTLEGWKMGVIQIKFFKAVSVFFLIIKVTHAAIRIFYENLLMCY